MEEKEAEDDNEPQLLGEAMTEVLDIKQGCRFGAMAPKMASSEKSQRRWVNFRRQRLSLFQFLAC